MNTHYRHFRETFLAKNYTFCGVVNSKGNLMIGLAVTNPADMFVKETGRSVAYEHVHIKPLVELVIPEGVYSGHVFHDFVNTFIPDVCFKDKVSLGEIIH